MSTTGTQQQVTPELRKWIVDQAQAGHSAESVLQAMRAYESAAGWRWPQPVVSEALARL